MSFFEHHSRVATAIIVTTIIILSLALFEVTLRVVFGLGEPVLYRSSPLFGYRLQPNQLVHRRGAEIRVNNLALRADSDWDFNIENKILFLGNSVTYGGTTISNHELSRILLHQSSKAIRAATRVSTVGASRISRLSSSMTNSFLPEHM